MIGTQIRFLVPVTVCVAIVQQDDLGIFIFDQGINQRQSPRGPILSRPISAFWQRDPTAAANMKETQSHVSTDLHSVIYSFMECNFEIRFQSNATWHFGQKKISPNATDFQLIAARLITQGLGFYSNLVSLDVINPLPWTVPKLYNYGETNQTGFQAGRMTYLDSIIIGRKPNDLPFTDGLMSPNASMQPIAVTWKKFENIGYYNQSQYLQISNDESDMADRLLPVALQMTGIMTEEIAATFPDKTILPLKFLNGTYEILHNGGPEFLMTNASRLLRGKTLLQLMQENNVRHLYGPQTLKVLEGIGYDTDSEGRKKTRSPR